MIFIDGEKLQGACSCGKRHTMDTKAVIIEPGCLKKIDTYFEQYHIAGKRAVVYDEHTYNAENLIRPAADREIVLRADTDAHDELADEVLHNSASDIKILIAVGSGTVHDITRYCARETGKIFISCPTAASVDGFCSTVCAMTWKGYKKTLPGIAPALVLADTDVIKAAPMRLTLSGVGDILGKYTALADWKIAHVLAGEHFCERIEQMTEKALKTVHSCCEQISEKNEEAIEQLIYALLLSGLAMQLMGNSRPASGSEHHISHLIEMHPQKLGVFSSALHGEKVGVAALLISEYYHKLTKTEKIGSRVREYAFPSKDELRSFYGDDLIESVLNENKHDCMNGVTPEKLIETWPNIRSIVSEIPLKKELLPLYGKIGMKATLSDIDVPEDRADLLFEYSPTVRNRMTLMRIKRMITL